MSAHGNYAQPIWLQILWFISQMISHLSDWVNRFTIRSEELCTEIAETRKLRDATPAPRLTSFPHFTLLPPELRHMIWEEALPQSRVLMLRGPDVAPTYAERILGVRLGSSMKIRQNTWKCNAKIPAVLHVSSEARAVALRHYRLGLNPGDTQPRIYVDFKRDVIGLSTASLESPTAQNMLRLTADTTRVRRLALAKCANVHGSHSGALRNFPGVTDVVVLYSQLWARGIVPPLAATDYEHWVRWQCARGFATWSLGGEDVQADIWAKDGRLMKWKAA